MVLSCYRIGPRLSVRSPDAAGDAPPAAPNSGHVRAVKVPGRLPIVTSVGDTTVFLCEEPDPGDDLYASGRFSGYVDLGGGRPGEQLGGATLADALAWARERAEIVLMRLFDSDYYSAGRRNPDPDSLPVWDDATAVRARRPRGLEMLDNAEGDPPVLWDVRFYPGATVDREAFAAYVQQHPRAVPIPDDAMPATDPGVRVFVRASTLAQGWALAEEVFEEARRRARSQPPSGGWSEGFSVSPHAPNAPVRFG